MLSQLQLWLGELRLRRIRVLLDRKSRVDASVRIVPIGRSGRLVSRQTTADQSPHIGSVVWDGVDP